MSGGALRVRTDSSDSAPSFVSGDSAPIEEVVNSAWAEERTMAIVLAGAAVQRTADRPFSPLLACGVISLCSLATVIAIFFIMLNYLSSPRDCSKKWSAQLKPVLRNSSVSLLWNAAGLDLFQANGVIRSETRLDLVLNPNDIFGLCYVRSAGGVYYMNRRRPSMMLSSVFLYPDQRVLPMVTVQEISFECFPGAGSPAGGLGVVFNTTLQGKLYLPRELGDSSALRGRNAILEDTAVANATGVTPAACGSAPEIDIAFNVAGIWLAEAERKASSLPGREEDALVSVSRA